MKIDLHIHTKCSDGTDDWKTILQKAEEAGIDCLSITDHNNVDVYFQMKDAKKYFSGKIIKGIEPECYYRGRCIELLGYDINVDKMKELLRGVYITGEERDKLQMDRLYESCVKSGMKFSPNIRETWDKKVHYYPGSHLHEDMKKYPENRKLITDDESWNNSIQFYRNYGGNKLSSFYVDETDCYPSAEKIYKIIRQAGGKVFIPHVFLYGDESLPIMEGLMRDFKIDGIECFYTLYTPQQTQFLLDLCKQKNLLVSAGSDYHGASRPHIKLGMNDARIKDTVRWI